ncbi:MAG: MerR family transcriptional regulator [Candidatus Sulfotelmatobacter sp.]
MFETFDVRIVSSIFGVHHYTTMQDRFTSKEVIALTGITPRQLQWWDERGVVKPEREGHRRLYSMNHLTEVAVICELRRKGFSLQDVRKVMRFLEREIGKRLAQIVSHGSDYHLLTDGTHMYLETSARQIVDILKNSRQPILAVCLSDAVRQVRAGVISGKTNTSVTSPDYRRRAKKVS